MTTAPTELDELRDHLDTAINLLAKMQPGYVKGREFYDGTRAEVFASPSVKALLGDAASFAPISLAHIPVDVIADKIELASLATEGEGKEALETVFTTNDLEDEASDIILKACYYGDYYTIIDPLEETVDGVATAEGMRIVGSSPLTTVMVYDPRDSRTQLYAAKVWKAGKKWRALLYYDDAVVKLVSAIGGETAPKATDYDLDVEVGEELASAWVKHEGGKILVKHLAVLTKPYGTPVHRKAWGPQDAITKISATNLTAVDSQGFPSRWALADPTAEIDDDIDDDFGDAGPPAAGEAPTDGIRAATTGASRMRDVPGVIKLLRGIKEVGQFDPASSEDFLKNLDWYTRIMAVATGVPLFEFDLTGEQPSGESRRRAEARVNKRAAKIKSQAGAFFREIGETALALLGSSGEVVATFTPSETATDKEGIELVGLKVKHGVPVRQALKEAGYTDEQVDEWYPDDDVAAVSMDMLATLGQALAQLGQAKTLGVITDEELAAILPTILTSARNEGTQPAALPVVAPPAVA